MNKRTVLDALKYLVAAALLVYVVYKNWGGPGENGLGDVWQRHAVEGQPVNGLALAAGVVFFAAALFLTLVRWFLLVRAQDLPFSLPAALRIGLVGFFFNTMLPGSVGGDIIKAAVLAREQSRRTVAVATVIMDRIIALWGLVWFVAILGGAFWLGGGLEGAAAERSKFVVSAAGGVLALTLAAWLLLGLLPAVRAERFAGRLERIPKVGGSAAEFWRAVWMYRCRQTAVFQTLVITWVAQTAFVAAFYSFAHVLSDGAAGEIPGLVQHFLLVPMGLVFQAVVPLPGGAGAGELGFGGLYGWFGGSEATGVLASLVRRVVEWGIGLGGYLVYLRLRAGLPAPVPAPAEPVPACAEG